MAQEKHKLSGMEIVADCVKNCRKWDRRLVVQPDAHLTITEGQKLFGARLYTSPMTVAAAAEILDMLRT